MKATAALLLALNLLAAASAVTYTYYTDGSCKTPIPNKVQGMPNPFVMPLDQCTQSVTADGGRSPLWSKATQCTSSTTRFTAYPKNSCSLFPQFFEFNIGTCLIISNLPDGAKSMQFTCSPASAASVATFIAVGTIMHLFI